jgi:integrase
MGQIRKRGTYYQIRYYRNGLRIEETTEYTKYDEARESLKKREGAIADGVPITATSTRITFDDAVKDVVTDYTVNGKKSIDTVERRIKLHLKPFFGGKLLRTINAADVKTFAAERLKAGAKPGEINRELAIVRRAFRLAAETDKYHGRIPKIRMLQEHNVRTGFFDDEMIDAVKGRLPAALRPVVTFAYVSGWRVQSEILPLEWRHVDREEGEVRLDPGTTKNQAGRVFPFTDTLRELFDTLWTEHEALKKKDVICPYVFHRHGKRVRTFKKAWKTACAGAGYPGHILHDLRRSAVRNMERRGLSRSVAMQLTGHKTESVYRRYAITSEADLREGVDRLNDHVAGTNRGDKSTEAAKQSA